MKRYIIDATYEDRRSARQKRLDPREQYMVVAVTPDGQPTGYYVVTPFPLDGREVVGIWYDSETNMSEWNEKHATLVASVKDMNGCDGKLWDSRP